MSAELTGALGLIVDLIIGWMVLEAAFLYAYRRGTGRGMAWRDFAAGLAAGLCLMLALRSAIGGEAIGWILMWLGLAGAAHAADLWLRWRSRSR